MLGEINNISELSLKLLIALVLGGLIGLEREFHGRAAGLRTHIMVCMGSAILMGSFQMFQDVFALHGAESVYRIDPGRVAAGIVTGIGFLGAGTIMRSQELIRGLTTAACIWFIATIGIVIGCGLYLPAIVGTLLGLLVLIGLDPIAKGIPSLKYGKITIISENVTAEEIEIQCLKILKDYHTIIENSSISADSKTGQRILTIFIRSRGIKNKHAILKKIFSLKHVLNVA
ncbi:MAG: MgtC/SapB family protein, partial [Thermodesulfobacteriota bacterium]|nr:MgtC/SapB family protein [Thermodesulfobacteriota bacterium]